VPTKSLHDDPEYWRKRAKQMRAVCVHMKNPHAIVICLRIADDYDRLAELVEMDGG
jgi:hypothetical protein